MIAQTAAYSTVYAAARSRAHGPTVALWHAVELHRPPAEVDGACELSLCGSLARIVVGEQWPVAARDVCPMCASLVQPALALPLPRPALPH
jgi:hypothetical protein